MALFGDGGVQRREPRSVVEFRAGKMSLSGTTVSPDTRKGLVYMKLVDNLMHFCWKDRANGQLEDDFIIFPGDAKMLRINQCTTGRVFLLKFKENGRKYFYWLQEPKEDKDEEYIKKVNEFIENPNAASLAAEMDIGRSRGLVAAQLQNMIQGGDVNQQQLLELLAMSQNPMEILSGRGVRGDPRGAGHGSSQRPRVQLGDLQSALESLQVPLQQQLSAANAATGTTVATAVTSGIAGAGVTGDSGGEKSEEEGMGLRDVLTPETLRPLARDEEVIEELTPHLPQTNEDTETAIVSPQFQQAIGTFSSALSSGQLGPLVTGFGLSEEVAVAAATGNVQRFAEALEEELKEKEEEEETEQEGDNK